MAAYANPLCLQHPGAFSQACLSHLATIVTNKNTPGVPRDESSNNYKQLKQIKMRKTILTIIISLIGAVAFAGSPYESAMQKGIDMLAQANSPQAAIDVTNYFERVAEANKNEWLPLYYAAYSSLSAGYQQEKSAMKDEWYQ